MRRLEIVAGGLVLAIALSGCPAFQNREWGSCAVAGAVVGGAIGGITGGVVANNTADDDATRSGAIGGGVVGGAALGALLGHLICDPVPEEPKPAPPPPSAPAPGTKISELPGANFDFNKATLRPEGKAKLDEAVQIMNKYPDLRVSVEGHTDSIGSDAYNQKLSERRADAVVAYLVSKGIAASRLSAKGFGESRPVADNSTEAGRAKNRRVELIAR